MDRGMTKYSDSVRFVKRGTSYDTVARWKLVSGGGAVPALSLTDQL